LRTINLLKHYSGGIASRNGVDHGQSGNHANLLGAHTLDDPCEHGGRRKRACGIVNEYDVYPAPSRCNVDCGEPDSHRGGAGGATDDDREGILSGTGNSTGDRRRLSLVAGGSNDHDVCLLRLGKNTLERVLEQSAPANRHESLRFSTPQSGTAARRDHYDRQTRAHRQT
jgi:hypothetical protein